MNETLFDRLGGRTGIDRLCDRIVELHLQNEVAGPRYQALDDKTPGPVLIRDGGRARTKWLADQGAPTQQDWPSYKEAQRRDAGHLVRALRVGQSGRAGGVALVVKGPAIDCLARLAGTARLTHAIRQRA